MRASPLACRGFVVSGAPSCWQVPAPAVFARDRVRPAGAAGLRHGRAVPPQVYLERLYRGQFQARPGLTLTFPASIDRQSGTHLFTGFVLVLRRCAS